MDSALISDLPEDWLQTSIKIAALRASSVEADLELDPFLRALNLDEDVLSLDLNAAILGALKDSELNRSGYQRAVREALDAGISVEQLAGQTRCSEHEIAMISGKVRCSFCLRPYADDEVIKGGSVEICKECLVAAERAVASQTPADEDRFTVSDTPSDLCAFCGRPSEEIGRVATAGEGAICGDCIGLAEQILEEESKLAPK